MKKISLFIFAVFLTISLHSQNDLYPKIRQVIQEKHPELNLNTKLIGFVVWSMNDETSRELNKNFEKTIHVYENAKLKGGDKGIAVLSINLDNLSTEAFISYKKDGIDHLIPVKGSELESLNFTTLQNAIYDSSGNEVYRNLNSTNVYSSINKLITR